MAEQDTPDSERFVVVRNAEGQYAIWPEARTVPVGWTAADVRGEKTKCLEYISEVWTDMRPLSLQEAMQRPR